MTPYRTPAARPPSPRRPWRCWVGWHALGAKFWRTTFGRTGLDEEYLAFCVRQCSRCDHVHIVKIDTAAKLEHRSRRISELPDDPIIVARVDASVPGSRLQVTDLIMSETTRRALTAGSVRAPPPPKNPGALRDQER